MRVKVVKRGQVTYVEDADMMIVEDDKGDPVSVACRYGPGDSFIVSTIDNEEEFNLVLHNLGINKTVVKVDITNDLKKPESLPFIDP